MITAEKIRTVRARLAESQEIFARRFGVHQSTIARWEEDGPPSSGPAAILVEALVSRLFKAKRRKPAPPQAEAIAP
jgi:DNA-binding transcriptional regulator YiaG